MQATTVNNMDESELLSVLRDRFTYEPLTGVFRRRKDGKQVGGLNAGGYVVFTIGKTKYYAHRLAWLYLHGVLPQCIDHINGIRNDNREVNLRSANNTINAQNIRKAKAGKSGLLGAHWAKSENKWKTQLCTNGKNKHIGYFETEREAHEAYIQAKRNAHAGCTV